MMGVVNGTFFVNIIRSLYNAVYSFYMYSIRLLKFIHVFVCYVHCYVFQ